MSEEVLEFIVIIITLIISGKMTLKNIERLTAIEKENSGSNSLFSDSRAEEAILRVPIGVFAVSVIVLFLKIFGVL